MVSNAPGRRRVVVCACLVLAGFSLIRCAQVDLGVASSNEICSDDFNRADADPIDGNWDVLINYPQVQPPEVKIINNRAWFNLPYVLPTGISRLTQIVCKYRLEKNRSRVSVEITPTANISTGSSFIQLLSRYQENGSTYVCAFANNNFAMARSVGGTTTGLAGISFTTLQANVTAKITFLTDGSNLNCTLEYNGNTYQLDAVDSTYATGKVGLYAISGNTTAFNFYADNFKVEALQ